MVVRRFGAKSTEHYRREWPCERLIYKRGHVLVVTAEVPATGEGAATREEAPRITHKTRVQVSTPILTMCLNISFLFMRAPPVLLDWYHLEKTGA